MMSGTYEGLDFFLAFFLAGAAAFFRLVPDGIFDVAAFNSSRYTQAIFPPERFRSAITVRPQTGAV